MLNSPDTFKKELDDISAFTDVKTNIAKLKGINFILFFVTKKIEIEKHISKIHKNLIDDVILWFAYPKGTSKKYKCDFNRDNGWEALGALGFEGVRMVSIDEDWSAMRFRKVEYIKKLTRHKEMALSKEGEKKVKRQK